MADRRFFLSSVVCFVAVRFLLSITQSSIANNYNDVSLHLWRYCKTCYNVKPCLVDGKPLGRLQRDFTSQNGLLVGSLLLLCGDIATQPGPTPWINSNRSYCSTIKCLYMNPRSVVNKRCELQALSIGQDLIFCVESWLKPDVLDCELLPSTDFTIHRRDRVDRVGGGVFLAVRNNISSVRRHDLETNAEIMACELRPNSRRKILAVAFYRPPDSDLNYLKEFKKLLRLATRIKFDQIIVLGDFNLPKINWSTGIATSGDIIHNYFTKIIKDYYLWQLVDFPTREDNTLDLILTTIPTRFRSIHGFDDIITTDHKLISFELDLKTTKKPNIKRVVYNFKKADWPGLKQTLRNIPWDLCLVPNDVNLSLANWSDLFLCAVDSHIPKSNSRNVHDHPWIDNEMRSLLKKKDRQKRIVNKTPSQSTKEKYDDLRRAVKQLLVKKRQDHALKLKESVSTNPKRFWSYVKSCTSNNRFCNFIRDGRSFITDSRDMANLFNRFFHSVYNPSLIAQFSSSSETSDLHAGNLLTSIELTVAEVAVALQTIDPNKACGPDNIPGTLLKNMANEIAPFLCEIFNMSLSTGSFPELWKRANISPVIKKDDPTLVENYRPISLLCITSKILERCVFKRYYSHLLPSFYYLQYGFLKGKSTVTQLLVVYHGILDSLADGKDVDVIHLDFSKAFDKVPHFQLLAKLQNFGITGPALEWIKSYLCDRHQRVVLKGTYSDWLPVTSGVPQGSILGPLLFLVYANDMPDHVSQGSNIAIYADDSKLYRTIDSTSSSTSLQADLDSLHIWSRVNVMDFSTSKCKVLKMSRKKLARSLPRDYHLNGQKLDSVVEIRDLGVIVTRDLSWGAHIEQMCAKANKTLGLVKRVSKDFHDRSIRLLLYVSLVRPLLEYASSLWSPHTVKYKKLIENIQRRATKFILDYPCDVNYMKRLAMLNIPPLEHRRDISDLILLFKSKFGLINANFQNFLSQTTSGYATRNFDEANYRFYSSHHQNYFINSYFPRTVKLWNGLPHSIKHASSLTVFKNLLHCHYVNMLALYCPP